MTEMLETQEATVDESFDDTGFLEGLDGLEESVTQGAEQKATAEPSHEPGEGSGEESSAESAKEAETSDPAGEKPQPEGEKPGEGFLEITYMGEKKSLSRAEAQELAEKGMNLDRVREQLGEMKAERARLEAELTAPRAEQSVLPLLRAYAKAAGGSMETLTAQMMQAVQQAGIPIEQPKAGTYLQDKAVSDWKAFLKAYPDIRDPRTELPKEVWERINQGATPVNAMIEHRQADILRQIAERDAKIKEFEQKEQAREQNEKNRKRAGGSLTSTAGGGEKDGFLFGFLEG